MPDYEDIRHLPSGHPPTAVAVGVFDGVHAGHQALLREMIASARAAGLHTAVVTFFPHPQVVLRGVGGRIYLTSLEERIRLLHQLGIDTVVVHPFDAETRQLRALAFVELLQTHLNMRQLWSGEFGLGYRREGTREMLATLGLERDYSVHSISALFEQNGERVSSSRIRRGLAQGDMVDVNACLQRAFSLEGAVIQGDKRGRTIDFPTANLAVWEQQIVPANGVYATLAQLSTFSRYLAATNVGVRPTVAGVDLRVETHLLDFSADLYGQTLMLEFHHAIRPEMKFNGLEELKAQIAQDVQAVRGLLSLP